MKLSAWVSTSDLLDKKTSGFGEYFLKSFIKQSIFDIDDPKDVLRTLKKCGVTGIELLVSSKLEKQEIKKINKMLTDLGIRVHSIHHSVSKIFSIGIDDILELFETAEEFSSKVVVVHLSVVGNKIFDNNYTNELKKLEKKYKIKIGMENSPLNPLWLPRVYSWREDDFCKVVGDKNFNITFDVTHLAQLKGDIINFYKKNKNKIVNIHLSDYKNNFLNNPLMLTKDTHLPLGSGELPLRNFIKELKKSKYDGLITMEINGNIAELCHSAKFVKENFQSR